VLHCIQQRDLNTNGGTEMKQVTFWDIIDLDENEVFYHAVHGNILRMLQNQAEDGEIVLWGRVEDEDGYESHERGQGKISCSSFDGLQMSIDNFYDEDGMILIMAGENPEKFNSEEYLVSLPAWRIVGGLRTTDDPELFELYSMEEMISL
jgi:hypothetical protein